jgi:hypothetical protein
MAFQMSPTLPPVPPSLFDLKGEPRLGAYQGSMKTVDLRSRLGGGLLGRLKQFTKLKRWVWGGVATGEVFIGFALVDVGIASNAFFFAVDLKGGRVLADKSFLGLPGALRLADRPGDGMSARMFAPGATLRVHRPQGTPGFHVELRSGDVEVDVLLDSADAPDPLAVLLPLKNGDLNFTQKTTLMPAAGTLTVGAKTWTLSGGFGGLDFTHGLFPRMTAWRWAFALGADSEGLPVGFNLTDGLSDASANENAIWIGRTLIPVQPPRFMFDAANLHGPWQVQTADGAVDLKFNPRGMHREDRNMMVVESHFAQVAGLFTGTLREPGGKVHHVKDLPGVTEDQRVLW